VLRLGAHLSSSGGWWRAAAAAPAARCRSLQLFLRAPGRWARRGPDQAEIAEYRRAATQAGLDGFAWAHAPYLINLATADTILRHRSVVALAEELRWTAALGLAGLVVHSGSAGTGGRDGGEARARDAIGEALALTADTPGRLVLEVSAGSWGQLGRGPAELARLVPSGEASRIGICIDTAHAWAAGYDLLGDGLRRLIGELDEHWGPRAPDLLHGNDTKVALGSGVDRHAEPGQGVLGKKLFCSLLSSPRLDGRSLVVEMPPGPDNCDVARVMRRLAAWARQPVG
jgi:deoxyribonuclease-4